MTSRSRILGLSLILAAGLTALAVYLAPKNAPEQETAAAITREAAAEATGITPHRALYDLHLADVTNDSGINNAGGQLLFVWGDSCDGWTIEQRLNLAFSYTEGGRQRIQTSLASWEAKDGSDFRFTVRRMVNGKAKEAYEGKAELASDGSGTARYVQPADHTVALEPKTLFPTVHTLQVLRAAKAGKTILTRDVFDGADEKGKNQITAVIGKPQDVPLAAGADPASLDQGRAWPVHMAFFAPDNAESTEGGTPDYEMSMTLLENGVAHDLVIDYGDFTVKATLHAVEKLPQPQC